MPMIKMTARKALGGALYEAKGSQNRALLLRRLVDFEEAAGPEHCALVKATLGALKNACMIRDADWPEIILNIQRLIGLMPEYTYGEVPAGTVFRLAHSPYIFIKRKVGREVIGRDELVPHMLANDSIILIDTKGL